ncbi:hypothetical protein DL96DRAFT_584913 [Flagelloscypha sp. PMI_526]|nr:hypothetical protein DL96DRAFT_584913 [Flagelloscypha sp. PMI_526]
MFLNSLGENDLVLDELLYAYQKQLPKAVLAQRFLTIIHVSDQKHDIGDELRHVLIQAISELPLLTPGTLESYSRERFEEVKQLSIKESEHEPATRLLFKWCLSRVLYTHDAQAHENLAGEFATTATLPPGMDGINKLLFNLHDKAPAARFSYTLGIMDHFSALLQEAEEGIEHCDLRAKYTSTLENIKFHDMDEDMAEGLSILGYPIYNQFCNDLLTLAESVPHSDLIDVSILTELGELRKACILITAGGDCIGYAVPYLVRTYFITAWLRSPKFASLLIYSYQHILSPNLFELVIMFIWMFVHTKKSDGFTAELSLPVPPSRGAKQSKAAQDLSES